MTSRVLTSPVLRRAIWCSGVGVALACGCLARWGMEERLQRLLGQTWRRIVGIQPLADARPAQLAFSSWQANPDPQSPHACVQLEQLIERYPQSWQADALIRQLAVGWISAGDDDRALHLIDQRAQCSAAAIAHRLYATAARAYVARGERARACALFQRALSYDTLRAERAATQAALAELVGEFDPAESRRLVTAALEVPELLETAVRLRARALARLLDEELVWTVETLRRRVADETTLGRRESIEWCYRQAESHFMLPAEDRLARAANLELLGQLEAARVQLEAAAVGVGPAARQARLDLARMLGASVPAEAVQRLQQLLADPVTDRVAVDAALLLGDLHVQLGDELAAQVAYRYVLTWSAHSAKRRAAELSIGWSLLRQGAAQQAREWFITGCARREGADRAPFLWGEVRAALAAGDTSAAQSTLDRLLALASASPGIADSLLSQARKLKQAMAAPTDR